MGVVIVLVVLLAIGFVAMWVSDGIWNGAGAAGRAVRRGLSGPQTRKPAPLQFRTRTPAHHLRECILRQVVVAPQAAVAAGLYRNGVSLQSISYAYGDVINTSFTAELRLEPEPIGTRGSFAITNWTQCGGDVSNTDAMNELSTHIEMCVRSMDPAAEFQRL